MDEEPKWIRFEKLVADIQRELAPNATVTHNDHIKGHDSGTDRQIDISVKQKIGQYDMLIAIDCKDYKVPVDIRDVEEFAGLIKDIRANKGAIVSAKGFTESAKRIGEKAGLSLYRLIDTYNHDWQTYVTIPVVCDFRSFKYQYILPEFLASFDPQKIELYDSDKKYIDYSENLIKKKWNLGKLPTELGEHRNILLYDGKTSVFYENQFIGVRILVNIFVTRRLFFGELPLIKLRGFGDEQINKLMTTGFITDWLDVAVVEKEWRRIKDINELAIKPFIVLEALDMCEIPEKGNSIRD